MCANYGTQSLQIPPVDDIKYPLWFRDDCLVKDLVKFDFIAFERCCCGYAFDSDDMSLSETDKSIFRGVQFSNIVIGLNAIYST